MSKQENPTKSLTKALKRVEALEKEKRVLEDKINAQIIAQSRQKVGVKEAVVILLKWLVKRVKKLLKPNLAHP